MAGPYLTAPAVDAGRLPPPHGLPGSGGGLYCNGRSTVAAACGAHARTRAWQPPRKCRHSRATRKPPPRAHTRARARRGPSGTHPPHVLLIFSGRAPVRWTTTTVNANALPCEFLRATSRLSPSPRSCPLPSSHAPALVLDSLPPSLSSCFLLLAPPRLAIPPPSLPIHFASSRLIATMMSELPALPPCWDLGLPPPPPSVSAELEQLLEGARPPPTADLDDLCGTWMMAGVSADLADYLDDDAAADAQAAAAGAEAAVVAEALRLATPATTPASVPPAAVPSRPPSSGAEAPAAATTAGSSNNTAAVGWRGTVKLPASIIQRAVGRAAAAALGRLLTATTVTAAAPASTSPSFPAVSVSPPSATSVLGAAVVSASTPLPPPPLPAAWTSPLWAPASGAQAVASPTEATATGMWDAPATATPASPWPLWAAGASYSDVSGTASLPPAATTTAAAVATAGTAAAAATAPPGEQLDGALRAVALCRFRAKKAGRQGLPPLPPVAAAPTAAAAGRGRGGAVRREIAKARPRRHGRFVKAAAAAAAGGRR